MKINNKEYNIDDLVDNKYMHKKIKDGIYLSDYQIFVLNKYKINYEKCNTTRELLYLIEEILIEDDELDDLENVSKELAEFNYYHNTNK